MPTKRQSPTIIGFNELFDFLKGFNLSSVLDLKDFQERFKGIYKKYHPIITWNSYISMRRPKYFNSDEQYKLYRNYFTEVTSDFCQALFLWCQGLYKPCNLILRSGIENFVRCLGIYENHPVLEITSAYDLFAFVRKIGIVTLNKELTKKFDELHSCYIDLCAFVHTIDEDFMSMITSVGGLPKFSDSDATVFKNHFYKISNSLNSFLFVCFHDELKKMHHQDYDLILDSLPASIKRLLQN